MPLLTTQTKQKIPSVMEVAPRYMLLTLLKWFTLMTWFTLLTRWMRGATMGKTGLRPETPFEKWLSHASVQEYFQIECRTRVSRSILKLNVARGCQGVFSNLMSHAGVQEYFQIECRTRGSRSIFKLNVARGCPGVFLEWMFRKIIWGLKGWTLLNTIDHY